MKLWYASASQSVHIRIDATGAEPLRGFPRLDALAEAGSLTALSLPVPTSAFVGSWPDPAEPDPDFARFAELLLALGEQTAARWSVRPNGD